MFIEKFSVVGDFYKLVQAVGAQGVTNMIKAHLIGEPAIQQIHRWAIKLKSHTVELSSFNDGNNIWEEVLYVPSFAIDVNDFLDGVEYCENTTYGKPIKLLREMKDDYQLQLLQDVLHDYKYHREAYIAAGEVRDLLKK